MKYSNYILSLWRKMSIINYNWSSIVKRQHYYLVLNIEGGSFNIQGAEFHSPDSSTYCRNTIQDRCDDNYDSDFYPWDILLLFHFHFICLCYFIRFIFIIILKGTIPWILTQYTTTHLPLVCSTIVLFLSFFSKYIHNNK